MADITDENGQLITSEAGTWKGTPYALIGQASLKGRGGDCSGSTFKIFSAAGFAYPYTDTADFPAYSAASGRFRLLSPGEALQDGDILFWGEHMAIHCRFANDAANATTRRTNSAGEPWVQTNDMWTAHHTGGDPYGPFASKYWQAGIVPQAFRYQTA